MGATNNSFNTAARNQVDLWISSAHIVSNYIFTLFICENVLDTNLNRHRKRFFTFPLMVRKRMHIQARTTTQICLNNIMCFMENLVADPFEFEDDQEVSPKYVKDGKKYGRHSRPGTDTEGDLSECHSKTSSTRGLTRQKSSIGVRSVVFVRNKSGNIDYLW